MATRTRRRVVDDDAPSAATGTDVADQQLLDDASAVDDLTADQQATPFTPINKLESCGVSAADIKKLKDNGYHTVESIIFT
ncbi:hypothetical protein HK405_008946, partial [Cladochytrium tenue]